MTKTVHMIIMTKIYIKLTPRPFFGVISIWGIKDNFCSSNTALGFVKYKTLFKVNQFLKKKELFQLKKSSLNCQSVFIYPRGSFSYSFITAHQKYSNSIVC